VPLQYHEDQLKPPLERMFHHLDLTPGAVVIVIATPRMAKLGVRFGNDSPVFMDATHSMVKYDGFKLSTLMVLDEADAGEPVAWAVVQHETTEVYTKVISCVKEVFELHANTDRAAGMAKWTWTPPCFLTDNSDAEINGVRHVPSSHYLACMKHVW
jgi:MULE transposase domain